MSRAANKTGNKEIARHCYECGKIFWTTTTLISKGKSKYCSKECRGRSQNMSTTYTCLECGKKWIDNGYRKSVGRGVFCSKDCQNRHGLSDEAKAKISIGLTGKKQNRTPEWNEKISQSNKGLKAGSKNHNWKGGVTKEYRKERNQSRYAKWRKAVLEIGKRVCSNCGATDNLDTHHIHDFLRFPELRYEPENGVILCEPCHYGLHHPPLVSGA